MPSSPSRDAKSGGGPKPGGLKPGGKPSQAGKKPETQGSLGAALAAAMQRK